MRIMPAGAPAAKLQNQYKHPPASDMWKILIALA
jgi:hypothetical protein